MKTRFYRDLKHKYVFTVTHRVTKCMARTHFLIGDVVTPLSANGYAKCSPEDKFDYSFGCELAKSRAKQKLARKIEKLLKDFSNKRNENKKPTFKPKHAIYYWPNPNETIYLSSRGLESMITMISDIYKVKMAENGRK